MTGFHSPNRLRLFLPPMFAAALAIGASGPISFAAPAQTSPADLSPLPAEEDVPPDESVPGQPAPDETPDSRTLRSGLGAKGGDVEVQQLGGDSTVGLGTLRPDNQLRLDMWHGSDISALHRILPKLPAGAPSLAMADLTRRLLLIAAAPPEGGANDGIFGYLRLERLYAAGRVADAERLGTLLAESDQSEGILNILARSQLLLGDDAGACRTALRMRLNSEDPFWIQLRAFCYLLDGATPAALLTANLMEEQKSASPLFLALLRRLADQSTEEIDAKLFDGPVEALEMAMLRRSGLLPPSDVLDSSSLAVKRTVALITLNRPTAESVTIRLNAAETAARHGALDARELQQIYGSVPFEPNVRSGAVRYARRNKGPWANALLYQAVMAQGVPQSVAEYLEVAFRTTRETDAYSIVTQVFADVLKAVPQTLDLAPRGYELGLAAIAARDYAEALAWRDVLKSSALAAATSGEGRGGTARAAQTRTLGALLRIAAPSTELPWQPELADGWTRAATQNVVPLAQVVRELQVLKALGNTLSPGTEAWLANALSLNSSQVVDPDMMRTLDEAALDGRIGETALLALVVLGHGGPQDAHPLALSKAIEALMAVGLKEEARRIGIEAVLATIPS